MGCVNAFVVLSEKFFEKADTDGSCRWTALAEYRLSPRHNSPSPATLFYKRYTRSGYLPGIARHPTQEEIIAGERARDHLALKRTVTTTTRAPLPQLQVGDEVFVQAAKGKPRPWNEAATILGVRRNGRSYIIRSASSDRLKIRSRRFLRLRGADTGRGRRRFIPHPSPAADSRGGDPHGVAGPRPSAGPLPTDPPLHRHHRT